MKRPPRQPKVTGVCARSTCKRPAKVLHECALCDHKERSCRFHQHQLFAELQEHVMLNHPVEYRAAKAAHQPVRVGHVQAEPAGRIHVNPGDINPGMVIKAGR